MNAIIDAILELADPSRRTSRSKMLQLESAHGSVESGGAPADGGGVGLRALPLPSCRPGATDRKGSQPLLSYPEALVTKKEMEFAVRERRMALPAPQNSDLRHARSAWDIARLAPVAAERRRPSERDKRLPEAFTRFSHSFAGLDQRLKSLLIRLRSQLDFAISWNRMFRMFRMCVRIVYQGVYMSRNVLAPLALSPRISAA